MTPRSQPYFIVDIATDGQIRLALAAEWEYELILLDLMIPKIDGIRLCRKLRSQKFQKPILLLTAKDSSADIVRGLDAGADDYVRKPCDLPELLARIRALLRRGATKLAPTVLRWENLPIIVVTAHTDADSIQQVFAAGANDFMSKSLIQSELVPRVISRIDRSRLQVKHPIYS